MGSPYMPEQAIAGEQEVDRIHNLEIILQQLFPNSCWDDSAHETAERWLRAMTEFIPKPEIDFNFTVFPASVNQLITVNNIEFSSLCAHHLFPFQGIAHVGYLPNKKMVGLSKIPRTVLHFARRPQTQEALTKDIASFLKSRLEAQGVAVVIQSQHTCMSCRGVMQYNATMTTSEMRGTFLTSGDARAEFLSTIPSLKGLR